MAGIGFALRDLMRKEGLFALVESQLHGVIVVAGPWFFTIIAMALPGLLHGEAGSAHTTSFVTLLLYVFSTTLVVTSPLAIGLTRQLSDLLYGGREDALISAFVGTLLLALLACGPIVVGGAALLDLPPDVLAQAVVAEGLVTLSWIAAPMLSTLRAFRPLTGAYAAGTLAFAGWLRLSGSDAVSDLLFGFNLGMAVNNAIAIGLLLRSFPGRSDGLFAVLDTMRRYWELPVGGLLYGLGIWADKWLMWGAPERLVDAVGLATYPTYDTAAFIAYVTTVPGLGLFIVRAETDLHERCRALYGAIGRHASRQQLEQARNELILSFVGTSRDVALLQLSITALCLLLPTVPLDLLSVPHVGVFIFRFAVLGAAFQSGAMMLCIVLFYFDSRRDVMLVHGVFLLLNVVCTGATLLAGLPSYGMGFAVAATLTFAVAFFLVRRALLRLLYLAFVRQNEAVAAPKELPPPPDRRFATTLGPSPDA